MGYQMWLGLPSFPKRMYMYEAIEKSLISVCLCMWYYICVVRDILLLMAHQWTEDVNSVDPYSRYIWQWMLLYITCKLMWDKNWYTVVNIYHGVHVYSHSLVVPSGQLLCTMLSLCKVYSMKCRPDSGTTTQRPGSRDCSLSYPRCIFTRNTVEPL